MFCSSFTMKMTNNFYVLGLAWWVLSWLIRPILVINVFQHCTLHLRLSAVELFVLCLSVFSFAASIRSFSKAAHRVEIKLRHFVRSCATFSHVSGSMSESLNLFFRPPTARFTWLSCLQCPDPTEKLLRESLICHHSYKTCPSDLILNK